MANEEVLASIAELKKGSRLSLGMVVLGALFLAGTVYYSATRLAPLEQTVKAMREEIAQLEARKVELLVFAAAADRAARPVAPSIEQSEGWIYLGRVSAAGEWAPQSDRVESPNDSTKIAVGTNVRTRQNTSLVDQIDVVVDKQSSTGQVASEAKIFIKPDTNIEVLALKSQESIGSGKLLWARARVSSGNLLQLGQ